MPPTLLVTVPEPVPAFDTVSVFGFLANVALTDFAESTVTMQAPVPLQAPLHPEKVEPLSGVAVRVTSEFWFQLALHVVPQLIPAGELVTVPVPSPSLPTVNEYEFVKNTALRVFAASMVTTHIGLEPLHAPLQPTNVVVLSAVAVNMTVVPALKLEEHDAPQYIPKGSLVMVPLPDFDMLTL
jgi:hypothetical protein